MGIIAGPGPVPIAVEMGEVEAEVEAEVEVEVEVEAEVLFLIGPFLVGLIDYILFYPRDSHVLERCVYMCMCVSLCVCAYVFALQIKYTKFFE